MPCSAVLAVVLVVREVLAASGVAQVLVEALGRYAALAHERLGLVQEGNTETLVGGSTWAMEV